MYSMSACAMRGACILSKHARANAHILTRSVSIVVSYRAVAVNV